MSYFIKKVDRRYKGEVRSTFRLMERYVPEGTMFEEEREVGTISSEEAAVRLKEYLEARQEAPRQDPPQTANEHREARGVTTLGPDETFPGKAPILPVGSPDNPMGGLVRCGSHKFPKDPRTVFHRKADQIKRPTSCGVARSRGYKSREEREAEKAAAEAASSPPPLSTPGEGQDGSDPSE